MSGGAAEAGSSSGGEPFALPPAVGKPPAVQPDIRLLVVEDNEFMQLTMKVMLQSIAKVIEIDGTVETQDDSSTPNRDAIRPFRMVVEFAGSGEGGWELLRSGRFDIALVDIHLPGVSGLDLSWCYLQLLTSGDAVIGGSAKPADGWGAAEPGGSSRSAALQRQTIIIACTEDSRATQEQLRSYGIHDVLRKPISTSSLRHMLHKWMPRDCRDSDAMQAVAPSLAQQGGKGAGSAAQRAGRVLLVEDDEITRVATDLVFRQLGMLIDSCTSGEEAMKVLTKRDYDLLLLDVNLPNMSGYALCSWYKEMCRTTGRTLGYVVAVTAEPDAEACHEFEIDRCLPKPLSTAIVSEAMQEYWKGREAAVRAAAARAAAEQQSQNTGTTDMNIS